MSVILNKPFESKYGFKSTGFSVDENGNIIANSIVLNTEDDTVTTPADFTVTNSSNNFVFALLGTNPTLTLSKTSSYIFDLSLTGIDFTIYGEDQVALYSTGLRHSDGTSGANAQSKTSGRLVFSVPANAPDTLYYGSSDIGPIGTINIVDPDGVFNTVTVNSTTESTSVDSGALIVGGGVGIAKNLWVGGTLTAASLQLNGVGIAEISSGTNLALNAENRIILKIADAQIGSINSAGLSISLNNSSINDSVIGDISPSTATFISASVTDAPVTATNVANKNYVDSTATALAIAFGL